MLVELLLFLLLSSRASSSEVRNNDKDGPEMSPGRLGYELLLSTLEDIRQGIQKLNSDMEMIQKSVTNNKQMLTNQKIMLDGIAQHFSRLLSDTSKIVEIKKPQINSMEISELNFEALPHTHRKLPESCQNVSSIRSGVRMLQSRQENITFPAYCDQEYEGGGWTVIQNRFEGNVNFYRGWNDYENGFGNLEGEFWLGLKYLHQLTAAKPHELHVVLEDFDGKRVVAKYSHFVVGSAAEKYSLKSLGTFSGDAGDSLEYSVNSMFSTFDSDNDLYDNNCAEEFSGAWWYKRCYFSNLNGLYVKGKTKSYATMMCWGTFRGHYYGLKSSRTMIRAR